MGYISTVPTEKVSIESIKCAILPDFKQEMPLQKMFLTTIYLQISQFNKTWIYILHQSKFSMTLISAVLAKEL